MLVISAGEGRPVPCYLPDLAHHLFVWLPCERLKVSKVWESNVARYKTRFLGCPSVYQLHIYILLLCR